MVEDTDEERERRECVVLCLVRQIAGGGAAVGGMEPRRRDDDAAAAAAAPMVSRATLMGMVGARPKPKGGAGGSEWRRSKTAGVPTSSASASSGRSEWLPWRR